jgi:hypothetical protein
MIHKTFCCETGCKERPSSNVYNRKVACTVKPVRQLRKELRDAAEKEKLPSMPAEGIENLRKF